MNQAIDPNNPQGDLPDLDLPGEEQVSRQPGDRPRTSSWIPKIVVLLVIAAFGFVVVKYFFLGKSTTEAAVPTAPPTSKFAPPVKGVMGKNAVPIPLDRTVPVSLQTTDNAQQLDPQNRILLLEKKFEQLTQDTKTRIEALEKGQKEIKDLGQGGGNFQEASKQFSENLEALKQKMGGWETQFQTFQTKTPDQLAATTQLTERVTTVEKNMGELKKQQQEKEREIRQNLPFKMLSVDMWNGKPYVAVSLAEKVSLITAGDVMMGWKVTSIDFDGGKAVFVKNGKRVEQTTER